tara:strand:- start:18414 stop:19460 length:1047 start_codon:yes stop_codon:yes gene_type:complete
MTGQPIRLLIVDDSVVMRSLIERMFEACADIEVASTAATTAQAFDFLAKERVDVILLDHEMPGQKGLDALPRFLAAAKGAHIIMLSSHCQRGSETVVQALSLGASDALPKPTGGQSIPVFAVQLAERLRRLAKSRQQTSTPETHYNYRPFPVGFELQCIGVGASTGGIHTLGEFLGGKGPERLGVPILLTQHLPEPFMPYYAQQVERMTDMPVSIAQSGQRLEPDHIYIAPGDMSLLCHKRKDGVVIALTPEGDDIIRARPSINLMFRSIARCFGAGALGVVLTGIGRDGTSGAQAIVEAGGAVIAQDRASSVIWGMPGSVTRAGFTSANLRPEKMFEYISHQAGARP